jgi:hypothetical protein
MGHKSKRQAILQLLKLDSTFLQATPEHHTPSRQVARVGAYLGACADSVSDYRFEFISLVRCFESLSPPFQGPYREHR